MAASLFRHARKAARLSQASWAACTRTAPVALSVRSFAADAAPSSGGGGKGFLWLLGAAGVGGGLYYAQQQGMLDGFLNAPPAPVSGSPQGSNKKEFKPDYNAVRQAIADLLEKDDYDDGSYGPILVRLAWHSSGTYDKESGTGGSNGALMRYPGEADWGANAGLKVARDLLEPVKARFPWITYSDLWTLAGAVAVEEMGGPEVPWRPGRADKEVNGPGLPDGRLPDASKGAPHLRDIFYRMGFNDQEIVALSGAHTLGRCHTDRSGYTNPWTNAPITFSNLYFTELMNNKWRKKKWSGPLQYEDPTGELMMLPTDMVLVWDKKFKKYVEEYAKDSDKFFADFAAAFSKLMELGVPFPGNPVSPTTVQKTAPAS